MLTSEQMEIRGLARDFAAGQIRPESARWDASRVLPPSLRGKLAELGFYGMRVSEADGGVGLDRGTFLVALEELAWGDAAAALPVALHNCVVVGLLSDVGSPGQRAEWLPRLASGERLGAWAVVEQGGGDGSDTTTRALRAGDGWILSGRKSWVVMASQDGLLLLAARTGEDPGAVGLFLVPVDAEGVVMGPPANTLGLRALPMVEVSLGEVRVSGEALLGSPDSAGALLEKAAAELRLGLSAIALGIARSAAEHASRYARERIQFGQPIASFEAVREKLGGMATRINGTRALLLHAASSSPGPAPAFEGGGFHAGAAMALLMAGETAEWVASQAVQIFGGYGYMRDYPVEKLMRDAQATQILGGTPGLLRLAVAQAVLGEVAQGE